MLSTERYTLNVYSPYQVFQYIIILPTPTHVCNNHFIVIFVSTHANMCPKTQVLVVSTTILTLAVIWSPREYMFASL